ncbi:NnrU family protein [Amorphus orientalis]|uniref:Membrane protein n=1 Tax=Amorphus orientalis TaxID=649198 RepID=A0AAE3VP08_9HYPH|nr:NnrU family protein [Amorphus orientalis]MDQ0315602.1 putative membrane protein [Amorphus orientalis]
MWIFVAGVVVFFATHLLPTAPALRERFVARLGDNGYRGLYSLVAFVGLVMIIWGYGEWRTAGPAVLYVPPLWTRHLTMLLMLPVFVLLIAAYAPGRIKARTKHPMILAVKIWAFAHLLANGDAASVALFGAFLAWGVIDRISLKRRTPAATGGGAAVVNGSARNDLIAIVGGLLVYALFVWKVHTWLIGVPVLM